MNGKVGKVEGGLISPDMVILNYWAAIVVLDAFSDVIVMILAIVSTAQFGAEMPTPDTLAQFVLLNPIVMVEGTLMVILPEDDIGSIIVIVNL